MGRPWKQIWKQLPRSAEPDRLSMRARGGTRTPTVLPTSTSSLFGPTRQPANLFPGAPIPRLSCRVGRGNR
jgi:hypothetical protein